MRINLVMNVQNLMMIDEPRIMKEELLKKINKNFLLDKNHLHLWKIKI